MNIGNFLYRQKQRINYSFSSNTIKKKIAEINRYDKKIDVRKHSYYIRDLNLDIPAGKFNFLFSEVCLKVLNSNHHLLNGKYKFIKDHLVFCFNKFRIIITSKSELLIIEEIFIKNTYKFLMPHNSQYHVIDIGMNVGISSLYFSDHKQVEKVHAFEPFLPTYLQAVLNFELNKHLAVNIVPHNFGLGFKKEWLNVKYNPQNKGINSSLIDNPRIQSESKEKILIEPAHNIISAIIKQNPQKEFILKIDTEGAEYDILKSLFVNGIHPKIKAILLEWHYQGSEDIEKDLLEAGFKLISKSNDKNSGLIYAIK